VEPKYIENKEEHKSAFFHIGVIRKN